MFMTKEEDFFTGTVLFQIIFIDFVLNGDFYIREYRCIVYNVLFLKGKKQVGSGQVRAVHSCILHFCSIKS